MKKIKYWLLATRPRTLPAGLIPVILGSSIAYADGNFRLNLAIIIAICSVLIQIIANFINEIFDYKKGADTSERIGPKRMVASGLILLKEMYAGVIILIIITSILGLIIIYYSDLIILLIGVLSLIFAYSYTGGPYPLAYNGLADGFVLAFFGIAAVCGTYYAITLEMNMTVFIASFGPGLISTNLLGVNNYRDIDTDIIANKNTLQVKIGKNNSLKLYYFIMILAYLVPVILFIKDGYSSYLLPLLSIPFAIKLCKGIKIKQGAQLNEILGGTGKLIIYHGLLSSIGFLIRNLI